MARPRKKIDPELVQKLASIHCTNEEIAHVCGCSVDTLSRRFRLRIDRGKSEGKVSLRREQWKKVQAGNTTMMIWLGKQLLGQKNVVELLPADDGGLPSTRHMSVEDLQKIALAARGILVPEGK